ncbi:MAG TPA: outer membrane beta-barrel domain-containing protein [Burkholderiaceae bacterium]|nr:outer membrane beta-barrel domain-containing protein [Burkholderiaceae bacterium]
MRSFVAAFTLATASALCAAQTTTPQQPGNEQVIQPQVERREVKLPKYPSKDFEIGAYLGTFAMQNFGSSLVAGVRLGYHISEDFFVHAVYGQTKVSDESFRQILPGGIFAQPEETLKYYNLSAGYNILPGEVFWGRSAAFASSLYLIAGIGNTNFIASDKVNHRNRQTINYGAGIRVLFHDRFSVQMDMRQHLFELDLLGKNEKTKNLEWTGGVSFYF